MKYSIQIIFVPEEIMYSTSHVRLPSCILATSITQKVVDDKFCYILLRNLCTIGSKNNTKMQKTNKLRTLKARTVQSKVSELN